MVRKKTNLLVAVILAALAFLLFSAVVFCPRERETEGPRTTLIEQPRPGPVEVQLEAPADTGKVLVRVPAEPTTKAATKKATPSIATAPVEELKAEKVTPKAAEPAVKVPAATKVATPASFQLKKPKQPPMLPHQTASSCRKFVDEGLSKKEMKEYVDGLLRRESSDLGYEVTRKEYRRINGDDPEQFILKALGWICSGVLESESSTE
ncbi:hypothetical protein ACFL2M_00995 [Patescibacteria group bacterium]